MPYLVIQNSGSRPYALLVEDINTESCGEEIAHNPNPTINQIRIIRYNDDGTKEILYCGNEFSGEGFDPN